MKIKEIEIKNFGKFSNQRFVFRDGIQVFYGENEFGKSTIYGFLKAMLFGMERGRGKAAHNDAFSRFEPWENPNVFYGENEFGKSTIYGFLKAMLFGMERGRGKAAHNDAFSRFEPWENPNEYAGTMRFSCGEKTFCLKRRFDRYTKGAVLICEDDGEELSVEHGDLDMLLNGLTAEQFENTAAIGQLGARPGQSLAAELQAWSKTRAKSGGRASELCSKLLRNRKQRSRSGRGRGALKAAQKGNHPEMEAAGIGKSRETAGTSTKISVYSAGKDAFGVRDAGKEAAAQKGNHPEMEAAGIGKSRETAGTSTKISVYSAGKDAFGVRDAGKEATACRFKRT